MREVFARRVATFLVLLLLAVMVSNQSGHIRKTLDTVLEVDDGDDRLAGMLLDAERRMLAAPSPQPRDIERLLVEMTYRIVPL